jgi:hypothetical protein
MNILPAYYFFRGNLSEADQICAWAALWPTYVYNFSAQEIPWSVGWKIRQNFYACQTNTKLLFHRVQAYFSGFFRTQNGLSTADRMHVCFYCLICEEICMLSRSGKEGKIIGNLIQSRDKIVSKTPRPALGPTSLYKVAQWPRREAVHSPPSSPTISSWTGAQTETAGTTLLVLHRLQESSTVQYIPHCNSRRVCALLLTVIKPCISQLYLWRKRQAQKSFLCNKLVNYWCHTASVVGKWINGT